jgi:hypothetical protein
MAAAPVEAAVQSGDHAAADTPDNGAGDERGRKEQTIYRSRHRSLAPSVVGLPVDVVDPAVSVSSQHGGVGDVDGVGVARGLDLGPVRLGLGQVVIRGDGDA